ncbi:MAG: GTP 3',8-cyclase MoaA [Planctomycetes bacterium]|nr:GTP 3',8-cyclase MoaA [Planctomycetota bacterium]
MLDKFDRNITNLRLSITDKCNLRCTYCMPSKDQQFGERENLLTYEEILRLVRIFTRIGYKYFRVTGGEPLLRKGATWLLSEMNNIDGVERISITTNGVLLARYFDEVVSAGVKHVNLSLDSFDPARFTEVTRGGDIAPVLEALDLCLHSGRLDVTKLNMVVLRGFNDDEIPDFVNLAVENDVHVRFIEYMEHGDWTFGSEESRVVGVGEIKDRIARMYPDIKADFQAKGHGPATYIKAPGWKGSVGLISPVSDKFCATCNRMRLTSDGRLKACLLIEEYGNLREQIRQGATDDDLEYCIRYVTFNKPEKHQGQRLHTMNTTGG